MKIMFVGSEAAPFSKTGGLGDVLGSLPKAIASLGHDVSVVLPLHKVTKDFVGNQITHVTSFRVPVKKKKEYAGIEQLEHEGVTFYFIDNEYYFGYRDTLYGHYDDGERYGYFNNAVLLMLEELEYYPDIIHCNDWVSGLLPFIFSQKYKENPKFLQTRTIFTIHNIAYQGVFSKELLPYLNVQYSNELEFDNMINFLKAGINCSDYITTVSKTYAKEILHDYFAYGMNQILQTRTDHLDGIVNGIDYDAFHPKADPYIHTQYGLYNYVKGKQENKAYLRRLYSLSDDSVPIIGMVSRLTEAKGFDLIQDILNDLLQEKKIQFVLLGTGDNDIEEYFNNLAKQYPNQCGVYIGYNEAMAHHIYAGVDMFLMPSRFEPCGLAQLISFAYGTLPIVRKTGGLRDTVKPFNRFTKEGTGFGFEQYDASDMLHAITEAITVYNDAKTWKMLRKRVMKLDYSWKQSAKQYIALYKKVKEK